MVDAVHVWLPDEDSNPDKQSQSLPCYRYTIGQYLTCFAIIFFFFPFVNSILKFFEKFSFPIDKIIFLHYNPGMG